MLLIVVVMLGTGGDVSTQTAVVPMPMLYLNGGTRSGAVVESSGAKVCFRLIAAGDIGCLDVGRHSHLCFEEGRVELPL